MGKNDLHICIKWKKGVKNFHMRFSNLEAEIARIGLSVEEVSNELGFAKCVMYNRLNGKTNWTLNDMIKVQQFVNGRTQSELTLDYLFAKGD